VESMGIARAWAEIEKANVILHLQDARQPGDPLDQAITARLPPGTPVLTVHNKTDLLPEKTVQEKIAQTTTDLTHLSASNAAHPIYLSARTGTGLDTLRQTLLRIAGWQPDGQTPWLARERHLHALQQTHHHLSAAEAHAQHDDAVLDLFAEELRLAHETLCQITGQFTSDDLLGEIFAGFCIGK